MSDHNTPATKTSRDKLIDEAINLILHADDADIATALAAASAIGDDTQKGALR